jgi:hypothetical protein
MWGCGLQAILLGHLGVHEQEVSHVGILHAIQLVCANSPVFKVENNIGKLVLLWGCQLLSNTDISVSTLISSCHFVSEPVNPEETRICHVQQWLTPPSLSIDYMPRYNLYFWIFYLCAACTLDTSMYLDHVQHTKQSRAINSTPFLLERTNTVSVWVLMLQPAPIALTILITHTWQVLYMFSTCWFTPFEVCCTISKCSFLAAYHWSGDQPYLSFTSAPMSTRTMNSCPISKCPFSAADKSGIKVPRPLNYINVLHHFALKTVVLLLNTCFWQHTREGIDHPCPLH